MSLVRLNVISETPSAASALSAGGATRPRWRWNTDAKLIPAPNGTYTVANFAKNIVKN
jgi:hypothetical protein